MRTICLTEYDSQTVRLTDDELAEGLALASELQLSVSARGGGEYALRPGSRVGTVVGRSLRVLVRPKIALRNVLFLLAYSEGLRWGDSEFPYAEDDLLAAMAWWLDREVGRAARFGLARAYVERNEDLTTIRGRIRIDHQLASRPGRWHPLSCQFEEYSEDSPLNRLLKAAHVAVLRLPELEGSLVARLIHRTRHMFGGVETVEHRPGAFPSVHLSRLDARWEKPLRIAELILRQRSLRDERGELIASTFTIDMNKLFEQFIQRVLVSCVAGTGIALEAQRKRELAAPGQSASGAGVPAILMQPDLVLAAGAMAVAVADVKYKEPDAGKWVASDIYQLMAYCVRLQLDHGLLIYAGRRSLTTSKVRGAPLRLQTIGVDLEGSPPEILQEAEHAARALIESVAPAFAA